MPPGVPGSFTLGVAVSESLPLPSSLWQEIKANAARIASALKIRFDVFFIRTSLLVDYTVNY